MGKSRKFSIEPQQHKLNNRAQHARFVQMANELGAVANADALDRVFGKAVPPVVPEPRTDKDA